MNSFSYAKATDLQDAIKHSHGNQGSAYIGGGTNLTDLMKYFISKPHQLIDINQIKGYNKIEETETGGLRLGALVTNADTAYHPLVESRYPLLSRTILAGASAQIRNMATNGGNLLQRTRCYYFYDVNTPCNKREPGSGCSAIDGYNRIMAILGTSNLCIAVYPSDMSVALAALEAVVNVSGADGARSIPFEDFHRLPGDTPHIDNNLKHGELITSIDLPAKGFEKNYSYLKIRDRNSYTFALVSVATALDLVGDRIKDARLVLGGVAHKPWRVKAAEDYLRGQMAVRENFAIAADIMLEGAVTYKYNGFKPRLARKAIIRNCMMAMDPSSQLPGAQPSL